MGVDVRGEKIAAVRADPRHSGILVDFDGTLSPIVDDPATAQPLDGIPDVLDRLAQRYERVAVVSGRPVAFLVRLLPPSLFLSGLYGLEVIDRGRRRDHPSGGAWREVVDDVASYSAARGPAGMRVESKGLSLTLHYRTRPEIADDVRDWAERQAARSGLRVRPARMSVELHPPIEADKGTAVDEVASGLAAVCFIGDDVGDLPAFDALDRLEAGGTVVLRVAVRSDEAPAELLARADHVVDGPEGVRASSLASFARSWSASQSAGVRAATAARMAVARSVRSAGGIERAACSTSAVPATSKGFTASAPASPSSSHAPASVLSTTAASRSLTSDALLGHQVEAVADRVHEQHVAAAERGHRPGEVVGRLEHDRRPPRRRPLLVEPGDQALDLLPVGEVLGQALPRRVHERARTPPAPATPGSAASRSSNAWKPAQQVLRQLDAVDPRQHDPVADHVVELGHRVDGGRRRATAAEVVGSAAEGRHRRRVVPARGTLRSTRRSRRPAGGVEAARRGGRPCPRAAPWRTSSGRTRSQSGVANGVWLKCTARRSGRRAVTIGPTRRRW